MNPPALLGGAFGTGNWLASSNSPDLARMRDQDVAYQFMVMIAYQVVGEFQSIDGISQVVNTEVVYEGGRTGGPRELLKHGKEGTVTLKFGMADRSVLWAWMNTVRVGRSFRHDVTVIQFSRGYLPVRGFLLTNAFPRRLKAGTLDAMGSSFAVDEIELAYDRVVPLVGPGGASAAGPMLGVGQLTGAGSDLARAAGGALEDAASALQGAAGSLTAAAKNALDEATEAVRDAVGEATGAVKGALGEATGAVKGALGEVAKAAKEAKDALGEAADAAREAKDALGEAADAAKDALDEGRGAAEEALKDLLGKAKL